MKFKENKYKKWYYALIEKSKNRNSIDGYFEKHHVIPKAFGGSNKAFNLVALTAREHYVAHLLLVYMVETADEKYKMIWALARFGKKSGRSFELARVLLEKSNKGKNNSSYGKKWFHNPRTNEIIYVLPEEELPDGFIKGLPYQRGGIKKNSKWVNNGIIQTIITEDEEIPIGWVLGKHTQSTEDSLIKARAARFVPEKNKEHGDTMRDRIQLRSPTGKFKKIKSTEVEEYLKIGWTNEPISTKLSKKCLIAGVEFKTLSAAALYFEVSTTTIAHRIKNKKEKWINWKWL